MLVKFRGTEPNNAVIIVETKYFIILFNSNKGIERR